MKKVLLLSGLFFVSSSLFAQEIDIYKEWKIFVGDNMEMAKMSYNDSKWKLIPAAGYFEYNGFPDFEGFGWARKKVVIPSTFKKAAEKFGYLNLMLGKIDDVDVTYFNGKQIGATGQTPPNYVGEYNKFRNYKIDLKDVLWDKENLIAVRIYDAMGNGGFWGNVFRITIPSDNVFKTYAGNLETNNGKGSQEMKMWSIKTKVPLNLKENAAKMSGVKLTLPTRGEIYIYFNGKKAGLSRNSEKHSLFIPDHWINWEGENEVVLVANKSNPEEEIIFSSPGFETVKWFDIIDFKAENNILADLNVTVKNQSREKIEGNLTLELVSDINVVRETKSQLLNLENGEQKNIKANFTPSFKGIAKVFYTFENKETGEQVSGYLWGGEVK